MAGRNRTTDHTAGLAANDSVSNTTGYVSMTNNRLDTNVAGSITVLNPTNISTLATSAKQDTEIAAINSLRGFAHVPGADCASQTVNATSEVWTYKSGGVSGTTVGTVTINYSDSTKATITSVVRT